MVRKIVFGLTIFFCFISYIAAASDDGQLPDNPPNYLIKDCKSAFGAELVAASIAGLGWFWGANEITLVGLVSSAVMGLVCCVNAGEIAVYKNGSWYRLMMLLGLIPSAVVIGIVSKWIYYGSRYNG